MNYSINIQGKILTFDIPKVMGIINVTNDSFYEGSRSQNEDSVLSMAEKMIKEGVDILDIGGYSSRPGADDISIELELERVIPAIRSIKKEFPDSIISIDTFRAKVLNEALAHGADICNDISGFSLDPSLLDELSKHKVPYILMHMKGNPQNMKELSHYDNMILEMIEYFRTKIKALNEQGIHDIILDPGFGFAKNVNQNFFLLKELKSFDIFELPILAGLSRKSMIWRSLDISADDALNGTTALNMLALENGASILRVHDVKEAVECIKLFQEYNSDRIY